MRMQAIVQAASAVLQHIGTHENDELVTQPLVDEPATRSQPYTNLTPTIHQPYTNLTPTLHKVSSKYGASMEQPCTNLTQPLHQLVTLVTEFVTRN